MFRIDESTASVAKPTRAAVGSKPNAHFTAGATTGTKVSDDWLEAIQEEVCNVIEDAGVTLNKEAGASPALDNQLYLAIVKMVKGTSTAIVNPFMNYALFRHEELSGTDGGGITTGSWQTRPLNATTENTIVDASLASNRITLPAGDYRIKVVSSGFGCDSFQAALYNISDSSFIDYGIAADVTSAGGTSGNSIISTKFTLATSKTIEIQQQSSQTKTVDGLGHALSFGTEVYAQAEIWKLD